jgi:hypothetical protein
MAKLSDEGSGGDDPAAEELAKRRGPFYTGGF